MSSVSENACTGTGQISWSAVSESAAREGEASARRGTGALLHQWGKDLQLFVFVFAILQLYRPVLIGAFSARIGDKGFGDLLLVQGMGLRFDISTAASWAALTFLASLTILILPTGKLLHRLRLYVGYGYVVLALPLLAANLVFFHEYSDQFNHHIFGMLHDDAMAILTTVWKEYHPLLFLIATAPIMVLSLWLVRRWLLWNPRFVFALAAVRGGLARAGLALVLFFLFVVFMRGGTLWGQPIRLKHAHVVNDLMLNRMVVNPLSALRYTLDSKLALERSGNLDSLWPSRDLHAALAAVRDVHGETGPVPRDIDEGLRMQAAGAATRPRHIFLVLMESHDGWTVMPEYRWTGFAPQLSDLAERGIYFANFLPTYTTGTIGALNVMMTGLPDTGLNVNYEPGTQKPLPSSTAETFRRMGYRTRFYYGGYLSWQRVDSFALAQGFDEVWGGGSMRAGASTNEWGVNDKHLFDFVLESMDDNQPSFNLILTTTNHPPFDLDLERLGYPIKELPEPLVETKRTTMRELGHLWYADQQLGHFVAEAERQFGDSLFAITGDHTRRLEIRFPGDSVVEQDAVPFVLYGPEVLGERRETPATAGSHLDVPATLFELAAPAGFTYYSFGRDLLSKPSPSYGLGPSFIIGENFLATNAGPTNTWALPGCEPPAVLDDLAEIREYNNALKALGWYRVRKGSQLPEAATE
ncbi:LTA synthase family protein [Thiohalomonas denitrificans]|uniref:LTA synthase family protein n=1 Tax=Thiohalomonas denitrificans TaxID=415747 RepID=UPI0026EB7BC7|nr:alkaline phosphatase family protein [Thiohalomonas denitrificans]